MSILTQPQAADLLGVTTRRLRQLSQEDSPPPQDGNGQYPIKEFGQWLRKRSTPDEDLDYTAERARLAKEQADKTALDNEQKRGSMADVSVVAERWAALGTNIKTRMMSIPSKAAPSLAGTEDLAIIKATLEELIHDALSDLSGSAPGLPAGTGAVQTAEATAEADGEPVG